jgi:GT2 family glycosyltransferase
MQDLKIGLITVLYKSDVFLDDFFKSIAKQTHQNYILYLIDNSYNETSTALIVSLCSKYNITHYEHINSGGNIGVAEGNNIGLKPALASNCDYVIILNNDIEIIEANAFELLLSSAIKNNVEIVAPKVLYYDTKAIWYAGGYLDNIRALGVHYTSKQANDPRFENEKIISYAPTCFVLVNSKVFNSIGTIDKTYFAYYDDTDFFYRCAKANIKTLYVPQPVILHKVSSLSGGDSGPFYIYYANRNKIYYIKKHFKGIRKYFALFYTLLSRTVFYIKFNKLQRENLVKGLKDGFKLKA